MQPQIPVLKEVQPLLEMDRDERKFDVFLTFHRSSLLVSDMKIFLPFTINLDPYIKKKIKEEQQSMDEDLYGGMYKNPWQMTQESYRGPLTNRNAKLTKAPSLQEQFPPMPWSIPPVYGWPQPPWMPVPPSEPAPKPLAAITTLPSEILDMKLSILSVNNICELLSKIDELNPKRLEGYKNLVKENNINGKVLLHCDLSDLKQVNIPCLFTFKVNII